MHDSPFGSDGVSEASLAPVSVQALSKLAVHLVCYGRWPGLTDRPAGSRALRAACMSLKTLKTAACPADLHMLSSIAQLPVSIVLASHRCMQSSREQLCGGSIHRCM